MSGCSPPPEFITKECLVEFLKESLQINIKTSQEYSGGMDGSGQMYTTVTSVQLLLDGEVISETSA